ncbi:MAG: cytochrome C oxidase subunit IV family protein [Flavobacteriales bacterium]
MAHQDHNLAIFKGAIKFKNNVQKIWGVFALLSLITIVEVALGITKPAFLTEGTFLALKYLNWIFLTLTIVKAYYITWDFMHMRDEKMGLRRAVVWTAVFLISYLLFMTLMEGDHFFDILKNGTIKFDF